MIKSDLLSSKIEKNSTMNLSILLFMCMCFACNTYVPHLCVWWPWKPEKGFRCPGTGVLDGCDHHVSAWTYSLCSLDGPQICDNLPASALAVLG